MRNIICSVSIALVSLFPASSLADSYPNNFHWVMTGVYRSAQPSSEQMQTLERNGIRTVLNLRQVVSDRPEARGTSLILYHVGMNPAVIRRDELISALRILHYAVKPVLIHCWHGSDRTGLITALYELTFNHATKAEVLSELRTPGYGYHEYLYPAIATYIKQVDVEALRKDVLTN